MNFTLHFDPQSHQLLGPAGSLPIDPSESLARRFLMLLEGECLQTDITTLTRKYGLCRQRYYQLRSAFREGGLSALVPRKTGPKTNYRRTDEGVRQVIRHCFLDPDASSKVIAQKIRQTHFRLSQRSVQRVMADYGLQKKTLRPQPAESLTPTRSHPMQRQGRAPRERRSPQRGA
jgi:hypothetical protein